MMKNISADYLAAGDQLSKWTFDNPHYYFVKAYNNNNLVQYRLIQ